MLTEAGRTALQNVRALAEKNALRRCEYFPDPSTPDTGCGCIIGELAKQLPPGDDRTLVIAALRANNNSSVYNTGLVDVCRTFESHFGLTEGNVRYLQETNDKSFSDSLAPGASSFKPVVLLIDALLNEQTLNV